MSHHLFGRTFSNVKERKGFTLLELVLYIGIFGMFIGFSVLILYGMIESGSRSRSRIEVEEEVLFAMGRIEWMLKGASDIKIPAPNTTSTELSVNIFGGTANPLTMSASSGVLMVSEGSSSSIMLSGEQVRLDLFEARTVPSVGSVATSVTVTLSLSSLLPKYPASTTVVNTFYLKK